MSCRHWRSKRGEKCEGTTATLFFSQCYHGVHPGGSPRRNDRGRAKATPAKSAKAVRFVHSACSAEKWRIEADVNLLGALQSAKNLVGLL